MIGLYKISNNYDVYVCCLLCFYCDHASCAWLICCNVGLKIGLFTGFLGSFEHFILVHNKITIVPL